MGKSGHVTGLTCPPCCLFSPVSGKILTIGQFCSREETIESMAAGTGSWCAGIANSGPKSIDIAWTHGTGAPKGPFQIIDTVGLATALNIVNQYQSVPGLLSPLFKKMMMPYNFKTMSKLLQDMLDKGEKFYE